MRREVNEKENSNRIKKNMEEIGLRVEDQTSSAADSSYQKIYVAADTEKYSFEYYFMKSDESADMVYQYAVSNLKNKYEGNATVVESERNSIKDYSVSSSDYYCEVLKKENTVLYVTAYRDYKTEAKEIVEELGY